MANKTDYQSPKQKENQAAQTALKVLGWILFLLFLVFMVLFIIQLASSDSSRAPSYLGIALFCLVLMFALILPLYHDYRLKGSQMAHYPPWISPCPDYWEQINETTCKRIFPVGKTGGSCTDKGDAKDFGDMSKQDKCVWSKQCLTPWEGIDNLECSA